MFGMNNPMMGRSTPFVKPDGPFQPQTQPAAPGGGFAPAVRPQRQPGARLAKTLLDMQFNRGPQQGWLGGLGGLADTVVDGVNARRASRAGVLPKGYEP